MTDTIELDREPRVRWFRRRPPATLPVFGRRVWLVGHTFRFLAFAGLVAGPLLFALAMTVRDVGAVAGWSLAALSAAAGFAASGAVLRRYARSQAATTGSRRARAGTLAMAVVVAVIVWALIEPIVFLALSWGIVWIIGF